MGPPRRGRTAFSNCCGLFQSHQSLLSPWKRVCLSAQVQQPLVRSPELAKHLACSFTTRCMRHPGPGHPRPVPRTSSLDREWQSSSRPRGSMFPRGLSHPWVDLLWVWITTATLPMGELREGKGLLQASELTLSSTVSSGSSWGMLGESTRGLGDHGRLPGSLRLSSSLSLLLPILLPHWIMAS